MGLVDRFIKKNVSSGNGIRGNAYTTISRNLAKPASPAFLGPPVQKGKGDPQGNRNQALKTVLDTLGLRSKSNPSGLNLPMDEAKRLYFGDRKPSPDDEARFQEAMRGNPAFDRKNLNATMNPDGSLTYRYQNPDKSQVFQFTTGNQNGKMMVTPGDYSAYVASKQALKPPVDPGLVDQMQSKMGMQFKIRQDGYLK